MDFEAFLNTDLYPHPVQSIEHIETHISHVFLTGDFAYKLKKPLKLPFLDFSTLEKRKAACEAELRLNKRYAADLYEAVLPVYILDDVPTLKEHGEPVEYVLRMKQFDSETLFSKKLQQGTLDRDTVVLAAQEIAEFHSRAESKPYFWSFETVQSLVLDNFSVLKSYESELAGVSVSSLLEQAQSELHRHAALIQQRQGTHVRELHGDLHLANICMFAGKPTLFDGLEFNSEYSNCDTFADLAFLIMDLCFNDRADLGFAILNRYLECTDDFEGLDLLNLYMAYRACVRAKVACLRTLDHCSDAEKREAFMLAAKYASFANDTLEEKNSQLFAIGGFSGSGKTTLGRALAEKIAAVHVRSDVTRKHLLGLKPEQEAPAGSYTKELGAKTYEQMLGRAKQALEAGFPTIVDAVFADSQKRKAAEDLASHLGVAFTGIWCEVPEEVAAERIQQRMLDSSDATVAILHQQIENTAGEVTWERVCTAKSPVEVVERVLLIVSS